MPRLYLIPMRYFLAEHLEVVRSPRLPLPLPVLQAELLEQRTSWARGSHDGERGEGTMGRNGAIGSPGAEGAIRRFGEGAG